MMTGEVVFLRQLEKRDSSFYYEWINDKKLVEYNSTYKPVSQYDHDEWFEGISKKKNFFIFSIVEKESDRLIGSCSLRNIDFLSRNAELQIRIGDSSSRGKGYGTEAVGLLLDFGFRSLNLNRIYLHVFASNQRASKSYLKSGMTEEGVLRQSVYIDGRYEDVRIMSILATEYVFLRKA